MQDAEGSRRFTRTRALLTGYVLGRPDFDPAQLARSPRKRYSNAMPIVLVETSAFPLLDRLRHHASGFASRRLHHHRMLQISLQPAEISEYQEEVIPVFRAESLTEFA